MLLLDEIDQKHSVKIDKIKRDIENINKNKLDLSTYEGFKSMMEDKFVKLTENYRDQIDRMLNNENYVEKYVPVYTQRMINESLEYVLKRKQKKKLLKFNEIKMPLLMQVIFNDQGEPNLLEKQRKFHYQLMEDFISE